MKVADYEAFVRRTDVFADRDPNERKRVSILGLAGEVGSLLSAVKKQVLEELDLSRPTDAIREEIGDILWYCFSLAQSASSQPIDILGNDVANLRDDMTQEDATSRKIQATLDRTRVTEFVEAVGRFPDPDERVFSDYQELAFLTARTEGIILLRVCLAVLAQLAAEIMRQLLPPLEQDLNHTLRNRDIPEILGETVWHLAAVASLMHLNLDDVVEENRRKLEHRSDRSIRTPPHDRDDLPAEQFPRRFEIIFVTVGQGRSRMYWDGVQLGDELTDNAYDEDGYRFHDVLHLALVAKLGWSPVLRKLMKRKRRSQRQIDEVEDGARAMIVEELVIKAIHAEGQKVARTYAPDAADADLRLFENATDISYRFLAMLHEFVKGLQVADNRYWEWEDAIVRGCALYHELRGRGQGLVTVDLETGDIDYEPEIDLRLNDPEILGEGRASVRSEATAAQREHALRSAALLAVGLEDRPELADCIEVTFDSSVKMGHLRALREASQALWNRGAIILQAQANETAGGWEYVVLALGDRAKPRFDG